jgi:hypothetical protein
MDGSRDEPRTTAGLDLGDRYSHLCIIDTESGDVMDGETSESFEEVSRR